MYEPKLSPMPIYQVPKELMDRPFDPRIDLDEKLDEDVIEVTGSHEYGLICKDSYGVPLLFVFSEFHNFLPQF